MVSTFCDQPLNYLDEGRLAVGADSVLGVGVLATQAEGLIGDPGVGELVGGAVLTQSNARAGR